LQDYQTVFDKMRDFTRQRDHLTVDELWVLEHYPVFTLGQAGKLEHILAKSDIAIIQSDRGGQVTYHGPGQLIFYTLIDLSRRKIGAREFVEILENSIIDYLSTLKITAKGERNAPGVYVDGKKIASVGLRIHKGRSYHGLSININADLAPFNLINPCGYANLKVINLASLCALEHTLSDDLTNIIVENINNGRIN
jgi:lipoyl(octanoyl) transferase